MLKWYKDFLFFFKKDERKAYLYLFSVNTLLIFLLFYLTFTKIPRIPDLSNMYLVVTGSLITLIATIVFEYSRNLARRKDLLWPYLEILDELNSVLEFILITIERSPPLNLINIKRDFSLNYFDNRGRINLESLSTLTSLLEELKEEQICSNINIQEVQGFCWHINIPYETLERIYPMFMTISDLYSKEFIGWTSDLYKNLQKIKRFCSYINDEVSIDTKNKSYISFVNNLRKLLKTIIKLYIRIEYKLDNYKKYAETEKL